MCCHLLRITPAYAGKSKTVVFGATKYEDHPRLRGEKFLQISKQLLNLGSPPLTRGKAHKIADVQDPQRITPAYAGKRTSSMRKRYLKQDHPRLRGEKPVWRNNRATRKGSPPLTRGKGLNDCS